MTKMYTKESWSISQLRVKLHSEKAHGSEKEELSYGLTSGAPLKLKAT